MCLFYLRYPNARSSDVFPRDLDQKVCIDFACKGKECLREAYTFLHPRVARDLTRTTVKAIAKNFATTKKGWLSKYHFRREMLPADVMAMLGGSGEGPTTVRGNECPLIYHAKVLLWVFTSVIV
jgi:hypothetical protein